MSLPFRNPPLPAGRADRPASCRPAPETGVTSDAHGRSPDDHVHGMSLVTPLRTWLTRTTPALSPARRKKASRPRPPPASPWSGSKPARCRRHHPDRLLARPGRVLQRPGSPGGPPAGRQRHRQPPQRQPRGDHPGRREQLVGHVLQPGDRPAGHAQQPGGRGQHGRDLRRRPRPERERGRGRRVRRVRGVRVAGVARLHPRAAARGSPCGAGAWRSTPTARTGSSAPRPAGYRAGQVDFYSVAGHELGHLLGIGTAPSWSGNVSGGSFVGGNSPVGVRRPGPARARTHRTGPTGSPSAGSPRRSTRS